MFGLLKKGLKEVINKFSNEAEKGVKEAEAEKSAEETNQKDDYGSVSKEASKEEASGEKKGKKGFVKKVAERFTTTSISDEKFNALFWQLEIMLLENNVAVEVIEKLKEELRSVVVDKPLPRGKISELISKNLRKSVAGLFSADGSLLQKAKEKKPFVILFAGINGSGKTTTIAKIAYLFQKNGMKCVLAASDTFRAAAIQQLQEHADKLGLRMIKHDYGADPAAVAFDAVKYARARKLDVVLIDTAGRLHSNVNLIDEIKKVARVAAPDMKIFVGESITGNDCVEQAKKFNEAIGIDAVILAKADVDEKGGAAISVSYVTGKPILYLGTGQGYGDLKPFEPSVIIDALGLEA